MRKIIVCFYVSDQLGSEYRAGYSFLEYARNIGFDTAIVADLEHNIDPSELTKKLKMDVISVPSPIKSQRTLYERTDYFAQMIWHYRVAKMIKRTFGGCSVLWIQNGAMPWLPVSPYLALTEELVWGPIGGGDSPSPRTIFSLSVREALREFLRLLSEKVFLFFKNLAFVFSPHAKRIICLARTERARASLWNSLWSKNKSRFFKSIVVVPEVLQPLQGREFNRRGNVSSLDFLWVGQDVPRKNLKLALDLFGRLRSSHFQNSKLHIFGADIEISPEETGVFCYGWVPNIAWQNFSENGVFFLTSFREGLPSVVLEALNHGLFCVCTDVGAISKISGSSIYLLTMAEYPYYSDVVVDEMAARIKRHFASGGFELKAVDFRPILDGALLTEDEDDYENCKS